MRNFLFALTLLLSPAAFAAEPPPYEPQEGDFLFQSLPSADLVDAIEGATHSRYSHVGVVLQKHGEWFVREALGTVRDTPLVQWRWRGRFNQAFDAYRLKPALQPQVPALLKSSEAYLGRPYDFKYDLDEEKLYCSELLYKSMLNASGLRLGRLQKLGELDWQPYRKVIEALEGGPVPLERPMITPRALAEAPELELVYRGYPPPQQAAK